MKPSTQFNLLAIIVLVILLILLTAIGFSFEEKIKKNTEFSGQSPKNSYDDVMVRLESQSIINDIKPEVGVPSPCGSGRTSRLSGFFGELQWTRKDVRNVKPLNHSVNLTQGQTGQAAIEVNAKNANIKHKQKISPKEQKKDFPLITNSIMPREKAEFLSRYFAKIAEKLNPYRRIIPITVSLYRLNGSVQNVIISSVQKKQVNHQPSSEMGAEDFAPIFSIPSFVPPRREIISRAAAKNRRSEITAYCPCEKCCGQWADGYTASGHRVKNGGRFVAAPKEIPFGTLVRIPGYNNGEPVPVLDRGSAITGNKLDVFFNSHQEALNFGRQYLEVRFEK